MGISAEKMLLLVRNWRYGIANPDRNPTTKQHAIVNTELNIVECATHPDKFIHKHH